jgi:hypothetical protein
MATDLGPLSARYTSGGVDGNGKVIAKCRGESAFSADDARLPLVPQFQERRPQSCVAELHLQHTQVASHSFALGHRRHRISSSNVRLPLRSLALIFATQ